MVGWRHLALNQSVSLEIHVMVWRESGRELRAKYEGI